MATRTRDCIPTAGYLGLRIAFSGRAGQVNVSAWMVTVRARSAATTGWAAGGLRLRPALDGVQLRQKRFEVADFFDIVLDPRPAARLVAHKPPDHQKVIRPAFLLQGVVLETIIAFANLGK
jgi:hypothetical protein